jgi:flagellar P-ring protein precursor FlgI
VIVPLGQRWRGDVAGLIATIEPLTVEPDQVARVVIDERTGTVVIGGEVALRPVAIAYGGLTVQISEQPEVSQPAPLGRGKTTVVPRTEAIVTEVAGDLHALPAAATLSELTTALNRLGVKPRDLIAILAALRAAGAWACTCAQRSRRADAATGVRAFTPSCAPPVTTSAGSASHG